MPILGTIASSRQTAVADTGAMFPLQVVTVGAGVTSVTFSNIPNTYRHLQLRILARTGRTGQNGDFFQTQFNNDTGSNYSWHIVSANGSSFSTPGLASDAMMELNRVATSDTSANVFGTTLVDILDYANTNKYKTMRYIGGFDNNGTGELQFGSGNWRSNNAVTSIKLTSSGAYNILQYSTFALYGVKSA